MKLANLSLRYPLRDEQTGFTCFRINDCLANVRTGLSDHRGADYRRRSFQVNDRLLHDGL